MNTPTAAAGGATPDIVSVTTVVSLGAMAAILAAAYAASVQLLPKTASGKIRVLFVWHIFDFLTHFVIEGSFLYNVVFVSAPVPKYSELATAPYFPLPMTPHGVFWMADPLRLYGAFYGDIPTAKLWQEYAKADRRWGGADLTIISLELLTVFVMAPLAVYVVDLLRKGQPVKAWFWAAVIASGELYGGFMTFAPEWLSGSPNLDTSNFMYMWVYLVFFNTLWVWFPLWILYEAYFVLTGTPASKSGYSLRSSSRKNK